MGGRVTNAHAARLWERRARAAEEKLRLSLSAGERFYEVLLKQAPNVVKDEGLADLWVETKRKCQI